MFVITKRLSKRTQVIAVFTAIALMGACFAVFVLIDNSGELVEDDPDGEFAGMDGIPISTVEDLVLIGSTGNTGAFPVHGQYYLTNNIDFQGQRHTPIGSTSSNTTFSGLLDGRGFVISNMELSFVGTTNRFSGLFGITNGAEIINLGINANKTIDYSQRVNAGGIVGHAINTVIVNCFSVVTIQINVSNNSSAVGGLVGLSDNSLISNSYTKGSISATFGGTATPSFGGVAGITNSGSIINSYTTASISSVSVRPIIGGIIGNSDTQTQIVNAYASGSLPMVGSGTPIIDGSSAPARLTHPDQASGVRSYSEMNPSQAEAVGGLSIYYTGMTANMRGHYPGWNFTEVWLVDPSVNGGFPQLRIFTDEPPHPSFFESFVIMDVTVGEITIIPSLTYGAEITVTGLPHGLTWDPQRGEIHGFIWEFGVFVLTIAAEWDLFGSIVTDEQLMIIAVTGDIETPSFTIREKSYKILTNDAILHVPILTPGAEITVTGLPHGISWYDFFLFGHVDAAGDYTITLTAIWILHGAEITDTQTIDVTVIDRPSFCEAVVEIDVVVGEWMEHKISLSDCADLYDISGLPPGLSLNDFVLSGILDEIGLYMIWIEAVWTVEGIGTITDRLWVDITVIDRPQSPSFSAPIIDLEITQGEPIWFIPTLTPGSVITTSDLPDGLQWLLGSILLGILTDAGEHTVELTAEWSVGGIDFVDHQTIIISVATAGGDDDIGGASSWSDAFSPFFVVVIVLAILAVVIASKLERPEIGGLAALIILFGAFHEPIIEWIMDLLGEYINEQ